MFDFGMDYERIRWVNEHKDISREIILGIAADKPKERAEAIKRNPLGNLEVVCKIDAARGRDPIKYSFGKRADVYLEVAGVPVRNRLLLSSGVTLNIGQQKIFGPLMDAMADGGIAAVVGGRSGGKTTLACEVMRRCILDIGWTGMYLRAGSIARRIKATFSKTAAESEYAVVSEIVESGVLVLDEYYDASDWESRVLDEIIDERYGRMRPTLIVSNLQPNHLLEALGPSVAARLRETGDIFPLLGENERERIRNARKGKQADQKSDSGREDARTEAGKRPQKPPETGRRGDRGER